MEGAEKIVRFIGKRSELSNLRMGKITAGMKGNRKQIEFFPDNNRFIIFGPGAYQEFYYDMTERSHLDFLLRAIKSKFSDYQLAVKIVETTILAQKEKEANEMAKRNEKFNPEAVKALRQLADDLSNYDQQLFLKDIISLLYRPGDIDEIKELMIRDINCLSKPPVDKINFTQKEMCDWVSQIETKNDAEAYAKSIIFDMVSGPDAETLQLAILHAISEFTKSKTFTPLVLKLEAIKLKDSLDTYLALRPDAQKEINNLLMEYDQDKESHIVEENELKELVNQLKETQKQMTIADNDGNQTQYKILVGVWSDIDKLITNSKIELEELKKKIDQKKTRLNKLQTELTECNFQVEDLEKKLAMIEGTINYLLQKEEVRPVPEPENSAGTAEITSLRTDVISESAPDVLPVVVPTFPPKKEKLLLEVGKIISDFDNLNKYILFKGISGPIAKKLYSKTNNSEILLIAIQGPEKIIEFMNKIDAGISGKRIVRILKEHQILSEEGKFDKKAAVDFLKKH